MKRTTLLALCLTGLTAGYALGQHIPGHPAPATPPGSMPAGHPAVPGADASGMPAGHPSVPGMGGGMGAMGNLPAGHPGIGGAATQRAPFATFTLKVSSGTKGGPSLAKQKVTVELYGAHGGGSKKYDLVLDDQGVAKIEKIATSQPYQPVITINYSGIEQQAVGPLIDGHVAEQDFDLKVFQTSEKAPAWDLTVRHVMITGDDKELRCNDIIGIRNPADIIWTGPASGPDKGVTVALQLPAAVTKLDPAPGGNSAALKFEAGSAKLVSPLVPGVIQYPLAYRVPVKDQAAQVTVTAPADTADFMLLIPQGPTVKADGLTEGDPVEMGPKKIRVFTAKTLKAGQVITINLSNVTPQTMPPMSAKKPENHP